MIIFPGQEIVFSRVGKFCARRGWNLEGFVATIFICVIIGLLGTMLYFMHHCIQSKRQIDYLVKIDCIEVLLHQDDNKISEIQIVCCTDQDGNKYRFSYNDNHHDNKATELS